MAKEKTKETEVIEEEVVQQNAEPKYKLGDEVWIMRDNKTYSFNIYGILTRADKPAVYNEFEHQKIWYTEADLYDSKESLLKSL